VANTTATDALRDIAMGVTRRLMDARYARQPEPDGLDWEFQDRSARAAAATKALIASAFGARVERHFSAMMQATRDEWQRARGNISIYVDPLANALLNQLATIVNVEFERLKPPPVGTDCALSLSSDSGNRVSVLVVRLYDIQSDCYVVRADVKVKGYLV